MSSLHRTLIGLIGLKGLLFRRLSPLYRRLYKRNFSFLNLSKVLYPQKTFPLLCRNLSKVYSFENTSKSFLSVKDLRRVFRSPNIPSLYRRLFRCLLFRISRIVFSRQNPSKEFPTIVVLANVFCLEDFQKIFFPQTTFILKTCHRSLKKNFLRFPFYRSIFSTEYPLLIKAQTSKSILQIGTMEDLQREKTSDFFIKERTFTFFCLQKNLCLQNNSLESPLISLVH